MSYIKCSCCGALISVTARFCPECGNLVEIKKKYCDSCGLELRLSDRFCPQCGKAVETVSNGNVSTSSFILNDNEIYKTEEVIYKKRCPKCGNMIEDKDTVCQHCGYIFEVSRGPVINKVQCPSCGSAVPETARVCPECGCRLGFSVALQKGKSTMKKVKYQNKEATDIGVNKHHKNHTLLVMILFIIFIVFLMILYYMIHKRSSVQNTLFNAPTEQVDSSMGNAEKVSSIDKNINKGEDGNSEVGQSDSTESIDQFDAGGAE